jgi:O-antigen/teichoic acid export membrane protein
MSFSGKIIKSGIWVQAANFLQLGVNFVVTAILARLLYPDDFGLIGIIFVYTTFITIFTRVGFGSAIIQKQDADQQQISTLYWLSLIFGLFSAIILFVTAPLAAWFYGYDDLIPLIRIISVNFMIVPLFQMHRKLMEKDLRFPALAKIDVLSSFGSGLIGIGFASLGYGVYSLVFQSISFDVINLIGIRFSLKWKPDYSFSLKRVKDMFYFSIKMKGAQVSRFFELNIDLFILGKLLPSQIFGFYALANRVIYFPIRRISYTFTTILFPSFSKIQEDLIKIKNVYLKTIQIIAIFVFPFILMLALYARPLVLVFLGEKWLPAAKILVILAASGALNSIENLSGAIFPAINVPEVSFKLGAMRAVFTGIAAFIGGLSGLTAAAVAILIAKILLFFISMFILKNYIKFTFYDIFNYLKGPLLGILVMGVVFFAFVNKMNHSLLRLSSGMTIIIVFYFLLILLTNFKDLKYFFQKIFQKA